LYDYHTYQYYLLSLNTSNQCMFTCGLLKILIVYRYLFYICQWIFIMKLLKTSYLFHWSYLVFLYLVSLFKLWFVNILWHLENWYILQKLYNWLVYTVKSLLCNLYSNPFIDEHAPKKHFALFLCLILMIMVLVCWVPLYRWVISKRLIWHI